VAVFFCSLEICCGNSRAIFDGESTGLSQPCDQLRYAFGFRTGATSAGNSSGGTTTS
jgi:hypothetical protein